MAANNSNNAKGYGNHLKLPNAFNWKAGRRSMLVDPITLEPVPYVTIPGVLRLHEINEVPVKHRKERAFQSHLRKYPQNMSLMAVFLVI